MTKRAANKRPSQRTPFLKAVFSIMWKDFTAEWRSRELLSAMLLFALLVILIFHFALELETKTNASATSGVLWVAFTFAGILGLTRSMAIEKEHGCLNGLLLSPVDRNAIYFGKLLGNLIFMLIIELIILPVYSVLNNINLFNVYLISIILLGSLGYVSVGTLLASMAAQSRTQDRLLPILLFPVIIPVIIAAVKASSGLIQGFELHETTTWIKLLITYDIIFITLAFMVFNFIIEE